MSSKSSFLGSVWSVAWGGHREPPGLRVLAEMFVAGESRKCPPEIENFPRSLGGGYWVCWTWLSRPITPLPRETLKKIRLQRLQLKAEKKMPLFAEFYKEQEIARLPEFYEGITDANIEAARNEAISWQWERYYELLSRPNVLVVFGEEPQACKEQSERIRAEMEEIKRTHPKVWIDPSMLR